MTLSAPHDTARDEQVRTAWAAYRDGLAGLVGSDYDTAEAKSWEQLQTTLREIGAQRAHA